VLMALTMASYRKHCRHIQGRGRGGEGRRGTNAALPSSTPPTSIPTLPHPVLSFMTAMQTSYRRLLAFD